jgi:peflin
MANLGAYGQQMIAMIDAAQQARLRETFGQLDRDKSGQISPQEFTNLSFEGRRITLDTAKCLVKVFDTDRSGHISFSEFAALFQFVTMAAASFSANDVDRSGKLSTAEVLTALMRNNFILSPPTVDALLKKFPPKPNVGRGGASGVDFDTYLQMSAFLGQIQSTFIVYDQRRTGYVNLTMDQLVLLCSTL